MVVTAEVYEQIAARQPDEQWELESGCLRRKPAMTFFHNQLGRRLALRLAQQLDESQYIVSFNAGRAKLSASQYYIPDLMVIPMALTAPLRERLYDLEAYSDPLPLVVEIWSPSTGEYDVDAKLPEYQRRGDVEIWRLHPYDRTLIAWRRQLDGSYVQAEYRGGTIELWALPGVRIDLDALFDI